MGASEIAAEIEWKAARRHILMLLDVDGTLSVFQPERDVVQLEPAVRCALEDLATSASLTLAYISGRPLADLKRCLPVGPTIYLAGLHGLEIQGPDGSRSVDSGLASAGRAIRRIADRLRRELWGWPGIRIDDKGLVIELHTRDASAGVRAIAEDRLLNQMATDPEGSELALREGDGVLELLPVARRPMGDLLRWIRGRTEAVRGPCYLVFMGNHICDETAFREVGPHGIAIATSDRPAGADVRLQGPPTVARLLLLLAASRPEDDCMQARSQE